MLLTKLKVATAVLLAVCLLGATAAGLAYSRAREQPGEKQDGGKEQQPQAEGPNVQRLAAAEEEPRVEKELRRLSGELKRLRAEHEELKKQVRKGKVEAAKPVKLVVNVYPVAGLTGPPVPEGTEAESLIRVLTHTVEPASWAEQGGAGSIQYFPQGSSLVIRQSPDVQEEVEALLAILQKTKTEQEKKAKAEESGGL